MTETFTVFENPYFLQAIPGVFNCNTNPEGWPFGLCNQWKVVEEPIPVQVSGEDTRFKKALVCQEVIAQMQQPDAVTLPCELSMQDPDPMATATLTYLMVNMLTGEQQCYPPFYIPHTLAKTYSEAVCGHHGRAYTHHDGDCLGHMSPDGLKICIGDFPEEPVVYCIYGVPDFL